MKRTPNLCPHRTQRSHALSSAIISLLFMAGSVQAATVARETGGPNNITDSRGNVWTAQGGFSGGWRHAGLGRAVNGTDDDALYRAEIAFFSGWSKTLNNGKYKVTLKMNDQWANGAGQRVFSVSAEGQPVLQAVDIVKAVGKDTAYDRSFEVEVKDGTLNLGFAASANTPSIAAIQVDTIDGQPQPQPGNAIRVSVMPGDYRDSAGNVWEKASGFDGGSFWAGDSSVDIQGTSDDGLYRPELYNMKGWSRAVANGNYTVTLKMREGWFGTSGQRVFNVTAEGSQKISNLDLFAQAGKNKAHDVSFPVTVGDGVLNLGFAASVNNAVLSAIQVQPGGAAPPPPPPPPPPSPPSGEFLTQGSKIIGPDGKEFVPMGANVGVPNSFNHNGTIDDPRAMGAVKAWNWNTLRVNMLVTDVIDYSALSQQARGLKWSYQQLLDYTDSLVTKYTSQKIVVMIASHDSYEAGRCNPGLCLPLNEQVSYMWQLDRFWKDMAVKYKNNPYVWFNFHNETRADNDAWVRIQERHIKMVRDLGANNIVIMDAPVGGQDLGSKVGVKFTYDPTMAPALAKKYPNLVVSNHVYGGWDVYTTPASISAYIDRMQQANLPLLFGEFGWHIDNAHQYDYQLKAGGKSVFATAPGRKIGMIIWHATHAHWREGPKSSDTYCLKNLSVSCAPFYDGGQPGQNLSELGQDMWNATH